MTNCMATFKYFQWSPLFEHEKPYEILIDIPKNSPDQRRSNMFFKFSDQQQLIRSVRDREATFSLDDHGFAFRSHPVTFKDWKDKDLVVREYLPQIEQLVRDEVEGADRVFVYDWRIRSSSKVFPETMNLKDPTEELHPALQPHVDCSHYGCKLLLQYHLPEEAEELWKKRVRIVNVWRPLRTVKNWPLALCDGRTVEKHDLISADRVRREFIAEGLWSLENLANEWYYWPNETPDEVILLKITDSSKDVLTRNCVHASFSLGPEAETFSRESIEVRVFVFSE